MTHLFSLISKSDIRTEFCISTSTLNRWIKLGLWPKPIKIAGSTLWRRSDVEEFLDHLASTSSKEVV